MHATTYKTELFNYETGSVPANKQSESQATQAIVHSR